ncbi:MAG: amidohydrolase family protein, partial [Gemmatimonadaceae bacterium]
MLMRRALFAVCVLALSSGPLLAQKPTLIVYGAKIFTGDSLKPWVEAIAVRGDRIAAVGTSTEIRALAGPETQSIDAEGHTVVPGFNDAHVHIGGVPWTTVVAAGTEVPPDPPRAEILAAIAGAAQRMSPGRAIEVIVGPRALDDTTLRRAALDSVAPQHRVMLSVWSGHGVILNSALLKSFGYDTLTNVPLGGFIERDGSGRPTG